ncbi:hypothetical protein [Parendozoicomonas haliclonae]|uniref:Uncharacterized protein n=1 Tax=Parendozoicomonas haliclonae TaxID=1960125 RepID=A0A1X7AQH6_9GAMM|nr:hypothetical protein [Parendozoicomonas haliclonae]SMA50348.1 hypothetical protein EHSB41UT_04145 [Parendozoicomonas haliclonae]
MQQGTQNSSESGTEKVQRAIHSLATLNASLKRMEEHFALQNARCRKVAADMKKLRHDLEAQQQRRQQQ